MRLFIFILLFSPAYAYALPVTFCGLIYSSYGIFFPLAGAINGNKKILGMLGIILIGVWYASSVKYIEHRRVVQKLPSIYTMADQLNDTPFPVYSFQDIQKWIKIQPKNYIYAEISETSNPFLPSGNSFHLNDDEKIKAFIVSNKDKNIIFGSKHPYLLTWIAKFNKYQNIIAVWNTKTPENKTEYPTYNLAELERSNTEVIWVVDNYDDLFNRGQQVPFNSRVINKNDFLLSSAMLSAPKKSNLSRSIFIFSGTVDESIARKMGYKKAEFRTLREIQNTIPEFYITQYTENIYSPTFAMASSYSPDTYFVCLSDHCLNEIPSSQRINLTKISTELQGDQYSLSLPSTPKFKRAKHLIFITHDLNEFYIANAITAQLDDHKTIGFSLNPDALFIFPNPDNNDDDALTGGLSDAYYWMIKSSLSIKSQSNTESLLFIFALSFLLLWSVKNHPKTGIAITLVYGYVFMMGDFLLTIDAALIVNPYFYWYTTILVVGCTAYFASKSPYWYLQLIAGCITLISFYDPTVSIVFTSFIATALIALGALNWAKQLTARNVSLISPAWVPDSMQGGKSRATYRLTSNTGLIVKSGKLSAIYISRLTRHRSLILRSNSLCSIEQMGAGEHESIILDSGITWDQVFKPDDIMQYWLQDYVDYDYRGVASSVSSGHQLHFAYSISKEHQVTEGESCNYNIFPRHHANLLSEEALSIRSLLIQAEKSTKGSVIIEFGVKDGHYDILQVKPQDVRNIMSLKTCNALMAVKMKNTPPNLALIEHRHYSTLTQSVLSVLYNNNLIFDADDVYCLPIKIKTYNLTKFQQRMESVQSYASQSSYHRNLVTLLELVRDAANYGYSLSSGMPLRGLTLEDAKKSITDMITWLYHNECFYCSEFSLECFLLESKPIIDLSYITKDNWCKEYHHWCMTYLFSVVKRELKQDFSPQKKRSDHTLDSLLQGLSAAPLVKTNENEEISTVIVDGDFTKETILLNQVVHEQWSGNYSDKILICDSYPSHRLSDVTRFSGIVSKYGSPLSHLALQCSYKQVPCIIGCLKNN